MRLSRPVFAALAVLSLGACSERYIAHAGEGSLVVVEDMVAAGNSVAARAIHILPSDNYGPLTGKAPMVRMDDYLEFDCGGGRFASRGQRFTLEDGEVLDLPAEQLEWKRPTESSVSAAILEVACDPEKAKAASTRNSLKTVIRRYKARVE